MPFGGRIVRARMIAFVAIGAAFLAWTDRAGAGVGNVSRQRVRSASASRVHEAPTRPRAVLQSARPEGARDPRGPRDFGSMVAAEDGSLDDEARGAVVAVFVVEADGRSRIGRRDGSGRVAGPGSGPHLLTTRMRC